jgi:hypothetical protein
MKKYLVMFLLMLGLSGCAAMDSLLWTCGDAGVCKHTGFLGIHAVCYGDKECDR